MDAPFGFKAALKGSEALSGELVAAEKALLKMGERLRGTAFDPKDQQSLSNEKAALETKVPERESPVHGVERPPLRCLIVCLGCLTWCLLWSARRRSSRGASPSSSRPARASILPRW